MPKIYSAEYRANPFGAAAGNVAAVPVGRYKGRNVYRCPVYIRCNDSRACATVAGYWVTVTARGAAEAADYMRDRITRPETEIIAVGPKGGEVHRYVGWHSAIARGVLGAARVPVQFNLI